MLSAFARLTLMLFLVAWAHLACAQSNIVGGGVFGDVKVSGGVTFSITNTDTKTDSGGSATVTYTIGGASTGNPPNIGTANANRLVVVGITARMPATNTISSVTIGGTSANHCTGAFANQSGSLIDIWYLSVPSGTTTAVVVTYSAATTASSIAVYSVIANSSTPDNGQSSSIATSAAISNATPLTVNAGGGFVAMGYLQASVGTSWTAPTHIVNDGAGGLVMPGNRIMGFAHDVLDSGSVTATFGTTGAGITNISLCSFH